MMLRYISAVFLLFSLSLHAQQMAEDSLYVRTFLEAMMERTKGNDEAAFDSLLHCVSIDSTRAEVHFFLAPYYYKRGERGKALKSYVRAAELDSTCVDYVEALSSAYYDALQYDKAIAAAEQLLKLDSQREDVLNVLIKMYDRAGRFSDCISCLDRLEQLEGKSEQMALAKSYYLSEMGDTVASMRELHNLCVDYPGELKYKCTYASSLLTIGQADSALAVYREVMAEDPQNVDAAMFMREYYKKQNMEQQADSVAMQLLLGKKVDWDAKAAVLRDIILCNERKGGDTRKVLDVFHLLLQQPQQDANMAYLCALYMDKKKMSHDSIGMVLHKVVQIEPDNFAARMHLLAYAWERNDMDSVVVLCNEARKYDPTQMPFYYYQGMAYYRQDREEDALATLQKGLEYVNETNDSALVADCYMIMGDLLYKTGDSNAAFAAYDSCLHWNPAEVGCLNNYAYFLSLENKRLDQAEQMSHTAVMAEPRNATYLDTYAWVLFKRGRYDEAKEFIDRALQNDSVPGEDILEHAGDIYALNGNIDQAVEYWKKAAETAPEFNVVLRKKIKKKKYIK